MFPRMLSLVDNVLPAISRKGEKSRLFYRKVLGYSLENSFWKVKLVHNFIIPKGFSSYKNFQLFIKLTLIIGDCLGYTDIPISVAIRSLCLVYYLV